MSTGTKLYSTALLPMITAARLLLIPYLLRLSCRSVLEKHYTRPRYLTDLVRKPLLTHVGRIPDITREVRGLFVHIDKLHQLRIQMGVSKRSVHHQRIVEMLWGIRIVFKGVEMDQLCLQDENKTKKRSANRFSLRHRARYDDH